LIDTINIKKFLVLNPDDGHVNLNSYKEKFHGKGSQLNNIKIKMNYDLYPVLG